MCEGEICVTRSAIWREIMQSSVFVAEFLCTHAPRVQKFAGRKYSDGDGVCAVLQSQPCSRLTRGAEIKTKRAQIAHCPHRSEQES